MLNDNLRKDKHILKYVVAGRLPQTIALPSPKPMIRILGGAAPSRQVLFRSAQLVWKMTQYVYTALNHFSCRHSGPELL